MNRQRLPLWTCVFRAAAWPDASSAALPFAMSNLFTQTWVADAWSIPCRSSASELFSQLYRLSWRAGATLTLPVLPKGMAERAGMIGLLGEAEPLGERRIGITARRWSGSARRCSSQPSHIGTTNIHNDLSWFDRLTNVRSRRCPRSLGKREGPPTNAQNGSGVVGGLGREHGGCPVGWLRRLWPNQAYRGNKRRSLGWAAVLGCRFPS